MILLAGPGPLHEAALTLFEAGHVPIVGTDIAAPLAATRARVAAVRGTAVPAPAGGTQPRAAAAVSGAVEAAPASGTQARTAAGPAVAQAAPAGGISGPLVGRLLVMCDALVRVGGAADDADMLVRLAVWEGKPVYYRIADVPMVG